MNILTSNSFRPGPHRCGGSAGRTEIQIWWPPGGLAGSLRSGLNPKIGRDTDARAEGGPDAAPEAQGRVSCCMPECGV
jgi:hypothetical protein